MMRKIAIGLAAAAIAIAGSTLSASALYGQKSGISKGHVSGAMKTPGFKSRTYGYEEERGRGRITEYELNRMNKGSRLTPREREHVRSVVREGFAELTPREREHLRGAIRERIAELSPRQREHLKGVVRERLAELTPRERAHIGGVIRQYLAGLSPRERADLTRIERERLYRHGPYGRR
jgi:hypothetical protein